MAIAAAHGNDSIFLFMRPVETGVRWTGTLGFNPVYAGDEEEIEILLIT